MPTEAGYDIRTDAAWSGAGIYGLPRHGYSLSSREPNRVVLRVPHHSARVVLDRESDKLWLNAAISIFSRMLRLPPKWDSYEASPVSPRAVASALTLLDQVMSERTLMPAIVPMVDGGVQIEWHSRGIEFEIEVSPSGRLHAYFENARHNKQWEGELDRHQEKLTEAIRLLS